MQERRSLERRDLVYYLRAFDRSKDELLGYVANISAEGLMLIGEKPIEPNTTFDLKMLLPAEIAGRKRLEFEANSRWCRRNGNGELFSSGFELKNIAPDDRRVVRHIYSDPAFHSGQTITPKRLFDVVVSFFGLLVLLPVFILIGLVTKLSSPGPIVFAAQRVGRLGRLFSMYKFTTMAESPGRNGPKITAHDDPRITRIGRFLRQTKLNELPQLFNVLKGEMSFVGPRPEDAEFVAHYTPEQREVLSVKPGITSLATISYAGEERMLSFSGVTETYLRNILPDKLRLDLLYVGNRSLLLDIDILVQTMLVLIPRFQKAAPHVEEILKWPLRKARQYLSWFAIDAGIALLSVSLAGALWRSAGPIDVGGGRSLIAALFMTALFSVTNWLTGVQRVHWRYASPSEAIYVIGSASAATILVLVANSLVKPPRFPAQMLIMAGVMALSGFLIARYRRRLIQGVHNRIEDLHSAATAGRERVLIVGAGDVGQLTILLLRNNPAGRAFHVIGAVDDDLSSLGSLVHRVPVLGVCDRIPEIVREKDVGTLVFAIHRIEDSRRQYLMRLCEETGARTVVVPDLLNSLRRSAKREEDNMGAAGPAMGSSKAAASFESTSADLLQQIQILAKQARKGDIADVARGLGQLDKALKAADSAQPTGHPEGLQPTLKAGDQVSL